VIFHNPKMSRSSSLGFFLFVLLNATLFIRPQEIVPEIGNLPIYNCINVPCLAVSFLAVMRALSPDSLSRNPVNFCMLCLLVSAPLSDLVHSRPREAIDSATEFAKLLIYYFLLVATLSSFARLHRFLFWLCILVTFIVSLAMLQFYGFINIPALEPQRGMQWDMLDEETGEAVFLARLQATGIYANSNDLARILVVGILLSLYFLGDRASGSIRFFWMLPVALFSQALHLTHSRGGLLGLLAGIGALLYNRFGRKTAILLAVVILPVVLLAFGGRQTNFTASEGTGQLRIRMWNDAFVALQGAPIFGIGMNQYAEQFHTSAHNSLVQCYVELGLVGGTLFFAIFYLPASALGSTKSGLDASRDSELLRVRPFLFAILVATVVGMLTSNRSYSSPTYLVVGLCASYMKIASDRGIAVLLRLDGNVIGRVVAASGIALAVLYVYVRLSARY
jgi:putative inorganic carbon (hco3(-)) transporter